MSNFKLKTMKTTRLLAILFISALTFTACSEEDDHHDDDKDHEHEEEINILRYTLTNEADATDVVTFTFKDEDGEGGADGTTEVSGALTAEASYKGVLELLHEEEDGEIENVGEEIAESEADEHEIFYITNVAALAFETTDVDGNNYALGFKTNATTGTAGTGNLTISVVHEGKKPNDGSVADALSGNGTTDIEVSFAVEVE